MSGLPAGGHERTAVRGGEGRLVAPVEVLAAATTVLDPLFKSPLHAFDATAAALPTA